MRVIAFLDGGEAAMRLRHHWPIMRTALAASLSFVVIATLHVNDLDTPRLSAALAFWLLAGLLYTQLVEYWCHRIPMHRRVRLLERVRLNHLRHHRFFHNAGFTTVDPALFEHIAGRFWAFPALLLLHYGILVWFVPIELCLAFLLGTTLHYVAFEVSHWFMHIEHNSVDRILARIPWLGWLRARQIEHHRAHHQRPECAFNFTPPYLGDRLAGDMPPRSSAPSRAIPDAGRRVLVAPARPSLATAPSLRMWRHPVVRYGSIAAASVALIGAVVLAHGAWMHYKHDPRSEQRS